ncbi:semaphorin-4D isoform X4 [Protopterus annectens]|uniref:semaphorin-4D isoform X4 n=1 Tax=Protopterus annectens TaxID=7888 RepID=UPI001CFAC53C|nr:semaphorin-4D isoform X4 [Protopterus annectens]
MDKLCSKLLNYCLMKCSVQNMAVEVVCLAYAFLFGVAAFGPTPRTVWKVTETDLIMFRSPEVYNYSVLLLNEDSGVLYVGARDAIFALDMLDIQKIQKQVSWPVSEEKQNSCYTKGKSKETECRNYIRVLQQQDDSNLYVCGTYAFQPVCDRLSISEFTFEEKQEEGKGKCPFSPTQSYTSVMVDGELYAGTVNNYWGSEPIITRSSQQSTLRTEYSIPWLNEPNFVYADVVREKNLDGDDDKIYFFLTETAVEFEFFTKLLVPRIVRVCKGDQGGQRTLQKKWTSFLKAKLACFSPELNFVFNVVHDVFILKTPSWKDTVFYGVFTSQLNNAGVSAVCAFNMTSVETVFTKGTFMQSVICDQTQTKWLQSSKEIPSPRPGMCINNEARAQNINSSLQLPDKTLQFIKDHPLIYDPVTPVGNRPKLIKAGVNYTQIAVKRVQAFDGNLYDVLFLGTAEGALHKAVIYDTEVHIVEEVQLFSNRVPVETLLLSSKEGVNYLYASSSTGVVQSPLAFCENYKTCTDCILARDPLCAWNSGGNVCVSIYKPGLDQSLVQQLSGDSSTCKAFPPLPSSPVGTSSLPSVRMCSPSVTITQPDSWYGTENAVVKLLPPFLSDQTQSVSSHGWFLLFCQALGPNELHMAWKKNGHTLKRCVTEQSHTLSDGRTYVMSWIKDSCTSDAEYQCSAMSQYGNVSAKVLIRVIDDHAFQDGWSKEMSRWKNTFNEHEKMMQKWKNAWENCEKKNIF